MMHLDDLTTDAVTKITETGGSKTIWHGDSESHPHDWKGCPRCARPVTRTDAATDDIPTYRLIRHADGSYTTAPGSPTPPVRRADAKPNGVSDAKARFNARNLSAYPADRHARGLEHGRCRANSTDRHAHRRERDARTDWREDRDRCTRLRGTQRGGLHPDWPLTWPYTTRTGASLNIPSPRL